jgi:DNA-binding XRE family transcriptional regulator
VSDVQTSTVREGAEATQGAAQAYSQDEASRDLAMTNNVRQPARSPFAKWCDALGLTYQEIAGLLDCSPQRVANLRSGRHKPGLALAVRIAKVSKGDVPETSWGKK